MEMGVRAGGCPTEPIRAPTDAAQAALRRVRVGMRMWTGGGSTRLIRAPTSAAQAAQPHFLEVPAMLSPGPGTLLQRILERTLGYPVLPVAEKAPSLRRWPRG